MCPQKLKNRCSKIFSLSALPYWFSFLLPALVFFAYFASKGYNVLTVDLGQQYVDLLAFYQKNLLTHPLRLIYTFASGLGNSMLGTDAYYLLSPFNLLLLLFPQKQLPLAILVLISVKIGAIGLASYEVWQTKYPLRSATALAASLTYALCGFVVANNLNLMWLDTLCLLPFLVQEIDRLFVKHPLAGKSHLVLVTFLIWFTNFYTGYMALLFGALYLFSRMVINWSKTDAKFIWRAFGRYLSASVIASFLCLFVLLPTLAELLQGKANSDAVWSFSWQFAPLKILGKLAVGSYSFGEMEDGMPNLFIGSGFLLVALIYFFDQRIKLKERLANFALFFFLVLSLDFTPLVLIWHMGQFPVWYPGRFSFILAFFALDLALATISQPVAFSLLQKILASLFAAGLAIYLILNPSHLNFLSQDDVLASCLFLLTALLYIFFIHGFHKYGAYYLCLLAMAEMSLNLVWSLNALSYQNNQDYSKFAVNVSEAASWQQKHDPTLYRLEKTFSRSDDDPFTGGYYGITTFNSISNRAVSSFMASLGYVHNSNSYTNQGGTLITDILLGIKYYLQPNYSADGVSAKARMAYDNLIHRADLFNYYPSKQFKQVSILKNQAALPLIFATDAKTTAVKFVNDDPAANQEILLAKLTGQKRLKLFDDLNLPAYKLSNLKAKSNNALAFSKVNPAKPASITFYFTPDSNDSYYFELPSGFDFKKDSLTVNDIFYDFESRDDQTRLVNIASGQKGNEVKIVFTLQKNSLDLFGARILHLQNQQVSQALAKLRQPKLKLFQAGSLCIKSSAFTLAKSKRLTSTIPYSANWLVYDQGQRVKTDKYANVFLTWKLAKGKHQLTLIYVPWLFLFSSLLSLITLLLYKIWSRLSAIRPHDQDGNYPI